MNPKKKAAYFIGVLEKIKMRCSRKASSAGFHTSTAKK